MERCWSSSAFLFAAVLALSPSMTAGAARAAGPEDRDPLIHDARRYSESYGVDLPEALRRLRLQGPLGELQAEMAAKEPQAFAGLWVQNAPSYRVFAQFTARGGKRFEDYFRKAGREDLAALVERRTVPLSLRQLARAQKLAVDAARANGLPFDAMIDVAENRVDLFSAEPAQLTRALREKVRTLKAAGDAALLDRVAVQPVEAMSVPQAYIEGGFAVSLCTSGYAVQSGSTLGVTTAGHCPTAQSYNQRTLPFQAGTSAGATDLEWMTAPDFFPTNRIYDGVNDASTPLYRRVSGTRPLAQQVVGEFVCKYGITTGLTCGTITSTTYQPGFIPAATPTYVYVSGGSVNLSEGGDSGGPWFSGEIAYGTHSGGGTGSGGSLNDSIYMPVDSFANLGLTVLTSEPLVKSGRFTYKAAGDDISLYTGIDASQFECAIAGIAALDGDINENGTGTPIATYLYRDFGHWRIRADFRSHNNHEDWNVDLLCLNKSYFPVSRFEFKNLGDNFTYNTGLSSLAYTCGIAGWAAWHGDIQENNTGDVIQAYAVPMSTGWTLHGDFRTQNSGGESWDMDLMCVESWAPVFRITYANWGDNVNLNTAIDANLYDCGFAGFAARHGDIQENGTGDIIQAYLYKSGGSYWARADFRTHNSGGESWDFDLLCVVR